MDKQTVLNKLKAAGLKVNIVVEGTNLKDWPDDNTDVKEGDVINITLYTPTTTTTTPTTPNQ
jgi:hypothetical protein